MGYISVHKESLEKTIKEGTAIVLCPGGVKES